MREKTEILDSKAAARAVARISYEILERNKGTENLCLVGILTKGAYLAKALAKKISEVEGKPVNVGVLDITPFRDDKKSDIDHSEIDFSVADKRIVLVDDVLYTGRTCRAAIDAIMSRGRPKNIQLAVLIDRGHRELPIRPDYIGKNLPTSHEEIVRVHIAQDGSVDRVMICEEE